MNLIWNEARTDPFTEQLGKNLIASAASELQNLHLVKPLTDKPGGAAGHHIVAHGSKYCEEARGILSEVGLLGDADAAWNCCPLPHTGHGKNSGITDLEKWQRDEWVIANGFQGAVHHADTYGIEYGDALAARLRQVCPVIKDPLISLATYQQRVLDEMREIRLDLLNGQMP